MRVQEHITAHQRAKFCREFRRYREQLIKAQRAADALAAIDAALNQRATFPADVAYARKLARWGRT